MQKLICTTSLGVENHNPPLLKKIGLINLQFSAFVAILAAAYFSPLLDEDEGFCAYISKYMVLNNDWLSISVFGQNRFDKPHLFFWLQALSFKFFGISTFTARIPTLLSSVILFVTLKKKIGQRASTLYFSSALPFVICLFSVQESVLVLIAVLSILELKTIMLKSSNWTNRLKLGLLLGFSFLLKGPILIGLVAIFIIVFILLVYSIPNKTDLLVSSAISSIIILIYVYFLPESFLKTFILEHNLNRFAHVTDGHKGPFYYYLVILFLGFFPNVSSIALNFFNKVITFQKQENDVKFHVLWISIVLIFFSFSATKLPHYISIILPSFLLILSIEKLKFIKLDRLISLCILAVGMAYLGYLYVTKTPIRYDQFYIEPTLLLPLICMSLIMFLVLFLPKNVGPYLLIICWSFMFYYSAYIKQKPVKEVQRFIETRSEAIRVENRLFPSLGFYSDRKILQSPQSKGSLYICEKCINVKGISLFSTGYLHVYFW